MNMFRDFRHFIDVNALQELRDDNKELKAKLDEHSAAMEKLQRGYDILDMEFKILQGNYSNLFASARAEIQRKTQMIAQLNAEKEQIMKNTAKGRKHIRRHFNQGFRASGSDNKKTKDHDPKPDNDGITCGK